MGEFNESCYASTTMKLTFGTVCIVNLICGVTGGLLLSTFLVCGCISSRMKVKARIKWPLSHLRPSSKLYMLYASVWETIGIIGGSLAFLYMAFSGGELHHVMGGNLCRISGFIKMFCGSISIWHAVCICMERFLLLLLPTSSYALRKTWLAPSAAITAFITTAAFAANGYLLFIQPSPFISTPPTVLVAIQYTYRLIFPNALLMVAVIGLLVELLRRNNTMCGGGVKVTSYGEAILAAKLMIAVGLMYLVTSIVVFLPEFIPSVSDNENNACWINTPSGLLLYVSSCFSWVPIWIKSYMFLLAESSSRREFRALLSLLFAKCRQQLNAQ